MTFAVGSSSGTRIFRPYIEWFLGMVTAFGNGLHVLVSVLVCFHTRWLHNTVFDGTFYPAVFFLEWRLGWHKSELAQNTKGTLIPRWWGYASMSSHFFP